MRLLMLGGTHHVGRAVVETALARGDDVTTLNRGMTGPDQPGVRALRADRTDRAALSAALGDGSWDAVIDTWSGAPRVVADAAALLAGRAGHSRGRSCLSDRTRARARPGRSCGTGG